jgi:hypothetical protein
MAVAKPKLRWFQFNLRALLLVVTLCAIPCSWLAVKMQQARREREAAAQIEKLGGEVVWSEPSGPAWLRSLLGGDLFQAVEVVGFPSKHVPLGGTENVDAALVHLEGLNQLRELSLSGTRITNDGLEHIEGLNQLKVLSLGDTEITDAGLEHLEGLNQLRGLDLGATKVTDAGLGSIKRLTQLQDLNLDGTKVTDAGLRNLQGLSELRKLGLWGTEVTDAGLENLRGLSQLEFLNLDSTGIMHYEDGVKKLKQALPNCTILCW